MKTVYVSKEKMASNAGGDYLGYSSPEKDAIFIRKDLPSDLRNAVLRYETDKFDRGEEGPFLNVAIPAIASVAGGLLASKGSQEAAEEVSDAQAQAAQIQRLMFEQQRRDFLPYLGVGGNALSQLASLYGLYDPSYFSPGAALPWAQAPDNLAGNQGGIPARAPARALTGIGGLSTDTARDVLTGLALQQSGLPQVQPATQAGSAPVSPAYTPAGYGGFESSPEYQLMQDALQFGIGEGLSALDRTAAASGGLLSSQHARDLTDYARDASAQALLGAYGDYYNRLAGLAGLGGTMTSGIGSLGQSAAQTLGQAALGAGQAQAAGTLGSYGALTNTLNQLAYGLSGAGGLPNLFGGAGEVAGQVPGYGLTGYQAPAIGPSGFNYAGY